MQAAAGMAKSSSLNPGVQRLAALVKGARPSRMPPVIFCDMDGSALNEKNVLTCRTIETLNRYRAAGGVIVFTTGRSITSVMDRCAEAAFWPEVCVGSLGTTILRPSTAAPDVRFDSWLAPGDETSFHIDSAEAVDFLETFTERLPNCHAWVDLPNGGAVGDSAAEIASVLDDFKAGFSAHYPHRTAEPSLCAEILASGERIPGLALWVRGLGKAEVCAALAAACKDEVQRERLEHAYTIFSLGVNCTDGTSVVILASKRAGKAATLRWICENLGDGYESAAVAAFGDGSNDVDMFAASGWSCAPANAEATARETASAVSLMTNADAPVNFIAAQLDAFLETDL